MARKTAAEGGFEVEGGADDAEFTLKAHRGEGMVLLAMDWKDGGQPPEDFVGFAIEYREPDGERFYAISNRLSFDEPSQELPEEKKAERFPSTEAPFQKFRWVHLPYNAELPGEFTYRVTPMFMNDDDPLNSGTPQIVDIELARETYPNAVNVAFTRGYVASQSFIDRYEKYGPISTLLPAKAAQGLDFEPTHPKADDAYKWMGLEARSQIIELLDEARKDKADVYVIAYDLNLPEVVSRLEKIKSRLTVIIDDSKDHGKKGSAENDAAERLSRSAGEGKVRRQHMRSLQHNKLIIVDGPKVKKVLCGSTNFSWRGFYVQANNAIILNGAKAVKIFNAAFDNYWHDEDKWFGETNSTGWTDASVGGVDIALTFSPHAAENATLSVVADDVKDAKSSVLFSLAFLSQTPRPVTKAVTAAVKNKNLFVYGISDKDAGIELQKPDGNEAPVFAAGLKKAPEPFRSEQTGGGGTRMHHKFIVLDFNTPDARVYTGSYNFSSPADIDNGENLLLIKDRKIATSYMVEAVRIFDQYHFRIAQADARTARKSLLLKRPPRKAGEKPWWLGYYKDPRKIRDRKLFA